MEEYVRDYMMAAAIFGLFTFVWFGWAQERPKENWRIYLGVGSGLGIVLAIFGFYLSINHWEAASALHHQANFSYYIIFVIIEFSIAAIVGLMLIFKKRSDYVAPWIAFIVGVHFFPLSFVFNDFTYNILGILVVTVSIISLPLSKKLDVANSTITGIGAGTLLLLFSIFNLLRVFYINC